MAPGGRRLTAGRCERKEGEKEVKVGEPGYSYRLRARAVEVKVEDKIYLYATRL